MEHITSYLKADLKAIAEIEKNSEEFRKIFIYLPLLHVQLQLEGCMQIKGTIKKLLNNII